MASTWGQIRDVLDAVLEIPKQERAAYLDQANLEPAARHQVDSLILSYEGAGDFLQSAAPEVHTLWTHITQQETWVGRRLGPYELIEEIGHGGMGSVYRAVRADDQYQKQVAIKLVRNDSETAFTLARFRAERQILAPLEHANIARLLDGGTTDDGVPYLVMELVDGLPIDRYCDSLRLPVRERLALFRSVCSAVEYAHQKLVIHRDLKPGNILVAKGGVPKLLDFGIAKILAQESAVPGSEPSIALLRILTPEYASPEQITGAPVSTATDVYSLGVVLYGLLSGHRPYLVNTRRHDEMARAICQTEPLKPSIAAGQIAQAPDTDASGAPISPESVALNRGLKPEKLRRQLAGDLDNIVLKALRKEPDRRYGSVEQFSEDIRRHIEGLPVRARKETLGYRAQKFAARNRWGMVAALLLFVSLCGGLIATLHEARLARSQQAKADRRFQDVRELSESLMTDVHDAIANLPGATPVRKLLVERALKYLDALSQDAADDRSLQMELATAYDKIGDVQGQPLEANLGDPAAAIASYEKALALREAAAASVPEDSGVARELMNSYIRISDLLGYSGDAGRALVYGRKEIPAAQKLIKRQPASAENRVLLARAYVDQGYKEARAGDRAAGLKNVRQGAAALVELLSQHPEDLALRRALALTQGRIGEILRFDSSGDADSLASFREAVATLEPALSQDPHNAEIRRILAYDEGSIGELLDDMNQRPAALAQERKALESFQILAASDPTNRQLSQDIACVHARIGMLLVELGEARTAINELEMAIAVLDKAHDAQGPQSYTGFRLLVAEQWLGKAHLDLALSRKLTAGEQSRHCVEARGWFQRSQPGFEALRGKGADYDAAGALQDIERDISRCTL